MHCPAKMNFFPRFSSLWHCCCESYVSIVYIPLSLCRFRKNGGKMPQFFFLSLSSCVGRILTISSWAIDTQFGKPKFRAQRSFLHKCSSSSRTTILILAVGGLRVPFWGQFPFRFRILFAIIWRRPWLRKC